MKFVDQVRVRVQAGRGGDGAVAWRREKYVPRGGPAGGDGGRGGDVVFVADRGLTTLLDLRYRQRIKAENGRPGGSRDKSGRSGAPAVVRVPVGTMIFVEGLAEEGEERPPWKTEEGADEMETILVVDDDVAEDDERPVAPWPPPGEGRRHRPRKPPEPGTLLGDLTEHGQEVIVARGGQGGRGNIHFATSTNRAPDYAEPGRPGEQLWLRLELKLLADVGIVGFPNVGKSTLISRISRARPKIADYPFTTLVPQLGVVALGEERSMVVADVPGLIEGASEGKGLGHRFLRHLERTRVLLHLLAPDPDPDREPLRDLDVLERELERYGPMFEGRPRVVALNKIDLLKDAQGRQQVEALRRQLRARNIPLFPVSAATGEGIEPLLEAIWRRLDAVRAAEARGGG